MGRLASGPSVSGGIVRRQPAPHPARPARASRTARSGISVQAAFRFAFVGTIADDRREDDSLRDQARMRHGVQVLQLVNNFPPSVVDGVEGGSILLISGS
jgi:hypothetical protein